MSYADSSLSKYVLKPLKFLQCYEDALQFIATLLCSTSSPILICYEIDLLTILKKYTDSIQLAKFVTSINPECPNTWLVLADLYLHQKKYEQCLKALNNLYFLKEFTTDEIKKLTSNINGITINEIPVQKLKITKNQINLKIVDLLYCSKRYVDLYYSSSQYYLCENSDVLQDTINKILYCPYFSFDKTQKKAYSILLEMIKEINFDTFIDLKANIFCDNNIKIKKKDANSSEGLSEEGQKNSSEIKISINPYLEIIINNLIEDLKIFSVVISQEDNYFQSLVSKEDLAIAEVKFCISFAIISERLKYYHTALKYYYKALKFCFSKFIFSRVIILNSRLKDYKTSITSLGELLECFPSEQFEWINKTPLWIDKIVLKVLYEYQASEILTWLNENSKVVVDFFKSVVNKYKYWVEAGHELHLIK